MALLAHGPCWQMDLSASERQEMTEGGRWGLGRVNDARKSTWLGPILARTGCQVMHIQVPFFASISVCQGIPGVTDGQMWGLTFLSLGQPFFPDSHL